VSQDASAVDIRKKYRQLALVHHPDRQTTEVGREQCHNVFACLSAAYEILSDDEKRKVYDGERKRQQPEPAVDDFGEGSESDEDSNSESYPAHEKQQQRPTPPSPTKTAKTTKTPPSPRTYRSAETNATPMSPSTNKFNHHRSAAEYLGAKQVQRQTTSKNNPKTTPPLKPPSGKKSNSKVSSFMARMGFTEEANSKVSNEKPSSCTGRPAGRPVRATPSPSVTKPSKPSSFTSSSSRGRPVRPPPNPSTTKPVKPSSFSSFIPVVRKGRLPHHSNTNQPDNPSVCTSYSPKGRPTRTPSNPHSTKPDKSSSSSSFSPRSSSHSFNSPIPTGTKPLSYSKPNTTKKSVGVAPPPFLAKGWKFTDDKLEWECPHKSKLKNESKTVNKGSLKMSRQSSLKGYQFRDPYEVFRKVFRDEFGEEFVPGVRPKTSSALPPKPTSAPFSKKSQNVESKAGQSVVASSHDALTDDRALTGKTQTKQILHENGVVETITITVITRPNGEKERIIKSSMETLTKAEQEQLWKQTNPRTVEKPTTQIPPSPSRKARVLRPR
jgi:curved DNA-binding protein CbpA